MFVSYLSCFFFFLHFIGRPWRQFLVMNLASLQMIIFIEKCENGIWSWRQKRALASRYGIQIKLVSRTSAAVKILYAATNISAYHSQISKNMNPGLFLHLLQLNHQTKYLKQNGLVSVGTHLFFHKIVRSLIRIFLWLFFLHLFIFSSVCSFFPDWLNLPLVQA